jgi:hypothetical protein
MGNTSSTKRSRTEGFDPLRPDPNPLGGHEADICLRIAERIDGYRTQIASSRANTLARVNQEYWGETERVLTAVEPAKEEDGPWWSGQVLWMRPTADGGLPHTRPPGYICLPSSLQGKALTKTLLHERVHLHQRRYSEKWNAFIAEKWNMQVWSEGDLPEKVEIARRLNPDLLPFPFFAWKGRWVSLAVYKDMTNPSLTGASTVWYDTEQKIMTSVPPDGWKEFFGGVVSDEHPWEIAAYLITDPNGSPASKSLQDFVKTLPSTFLETQ